MSEIKVYSYISDPWQIQAWQGGKPTLETILKAGKGEEFLQYIDECFPDGLSETELNDILWFESEQVFRELGIKNPYGDNEDTEEDDEEEDDGCEEADEEDSQPQENPENKP